MIIEYIPRCPRNRELFYHHPYMLIRRAVYPEPLATASFGLKMSESMYLHLVYPDRFRSIRASSPSKSPQLTKVHTWYTQ